jgi:hypothetical protein
MKLTRFVTTSAIVWSSLAPAIQATPALFRRQDGAAATSAAPTGARSSQSPATATTTSASSLAAKNQTASMSLVPSASATESSLTLFPSGIANQTIPAGKLADVDGMDWIDTDLQAGSLPIQPALDPPMGIAGAFLIIVGLVYAFLGLRNSKQVLDQALSAKC